MNQPTTNHNILTYWINKLDKQFNKKIKQAICIYTISALPEYKNYEIVNHFLNHVNHNITINYTQNKKATSNTKKLTKIFLVTESVKSIFYQFLTTQSYCITKLENNNNFKTLQNHLNSIEQDWIDVINQDYKFFEKLQESSQSIKKEAEKQLTTLKNLYTLYQKPTEVINFTSTDISLQRYISRVLNNSEASNFLDPNIYLYKKYIESQFLKLTTLNNLIFEEFIINTQSIIEPLLDTIQQIKTSLNNYGQDCSIYLLYKVPYCDNGPTGKSVGDYHISNRIDNAYNLYSESTHPNPYNKQCTDNNYQELYISTILPRFDKYFAPIIHYLSLPAIGEIINNEMQDLKIDIIKYSYHYNGKLSKTTIFNFCKDFCKIVDFNIVFRKTINQHIYNLLLCSSDDTYKSTVRIFQMHIQELCIFYKNNIFSLKNYNNLGIYFFSDNLALKLKYEQYLSCIDNLINVIDKHITSQINKQDNKALSKSEITILSYYRNKLILNDHNSELDKNELADITNIQNNRASRIDNYLQYDYSQTVLNLISENKPILLNTLNIH